MFADVCSYSLGRCSISQRASANLKVCLACVNSLDPARINQYISSCYATIHGAWHNGRAGKLCYGFDGTRADLSELTVTWESSWCQCRSSALGVRA